MAKRKHSTALFEVITQSTQYSKAPPKPLDPPKVSHGILATAKEWLKQRKPATPAAPQAALPVASYSAIAPAREVIVNTPQLDTAPANSVVSSGATNDSYATEPSTEESDLYAQPVAMAVDSENRQIALRMSYSAAFIAVASVLLIVGLSLVIGQHLSRGGVPLLAQTTTAELLRNPPHPEVLDPIRRTSPGNRGSSDNSLLHSAPPGTAENRAGNEAHSPIPPTAGDGKRYIGLNYIVVQSYPVAEEKMAREAAAFLNNEGVKCTIETGVKGYLPITVVGLQGFDKQSSQGCKEHIRRILQLNAKYTNNRRSYKALDPVAKKWDKQD